VLRPGQLNENLGRDQIEVCVVRESRQYSDSFQKLQQLCILRSRPRIESQNGEKILPSKPCLSPIASGTSSPGLGSQGPDSEILPRNTSNDQPSAAGNTPAIPAKDRPDTLRIQNIPIMLTIQQVVDEVWKNFGSPPHIHSLAPTTQRDSCATATFPLKAYDFPVRKLESKEITRGDYKFEYDAGFEGFTSLNSPKKHHAE